MLQRQEIFKRARVRFSQNGEFVQVFRDDNPIFYIFTKNGDLVYQGNSKEIIPDIQLLDGVFVSEKADQVLLATDLLIYLFTMQGKLLWTNPTPGIALSECHFFRVKKIVAFKMATGGSEEDQYNVQIHSLTTGEKLEEIIGVADIASINDRLIVKRGGQYVEYQIR